MIKNYFRILVLFVMVFFGLNGVVAQTLYNAAQIPFQTYTTNAGSLPSNDDAYSVSLPITFDFNFFDTNYNTVLVGTNGVLNFNAALMGQSAPWSISQPIPSATFDVKNSVLGAYHDMDNSSNVGAITYAVVGAAPYRKFVVMFNNQPHFSCTSLRSSFQMILHETFNFIDVQLIDKPVCAAWNNGRAISGIINQNGSYGIAVHNMGQWQAHNEGWRYAPLGGANVYNYTICDDNTDGLGIFNMGVAQTDLNAANPANVTFYNSLTDAQSDVNAFSNLNYTNTTAGLQKIYARNGAVVYEVVLRVVNCANDFDLDSVATASEDLNADSNLANDDTDHDGIPNFTDNDDDGDIVLTQYEYVFGRNTNNATVYLDTDNDTVLNYLDNDDDGDGVLTKNEDYNGNFNPSDDDTNANSIPDYLEQAVALGTAEFGLQNSVLLYPNPASDVITIENISDKKIKEINIYNLNGQLVETIHQNKTFESHSISRLQTGVYFVKINLEDKVINTKFIKK
jgi:type IX secretion system substrate protein